MGLALGFMSLDSEVKLPIAVGSLMFPLKHVNMLLFVIAAGCLCPGKGGPGSGCGLGACQGGSSGGRQTTSVSRVLDSNLFHFHSMNALSMLGKGKEWILIRLLPVFSAQVVGADGG